MNDPLSDPRARDLLSADPNEVWTLGSTFRRVAGDAESIATALRGAEHGARWTGTAANAFRANLGQIPGEVEQVHSSYLDVANALSAYEGQLASVQPAFQRLAEQLTAARGSLTRAQGQLNTAQGHLLAAENGPLLSPSQASTRIKSAQHAVSLANGPVATYQGEVSRLEAQGNHLLDEFQQARDGCQSKVRGASAIAPHHQSWWDHLLHDVGNGLSTGARDFWSFYKAANGLDQIANFIEHPGWKSLEDLLDYAGVAAMVGATVWALCEGDPEAAEELPEEVEALEALGEGEDQNDPELFETLVKAAGVQTYEANAVYDAAQGHYRSAGSDLLHALLEASGVTVAHKGSGAEAGDRAGVIGPAVQHAKLLPYVRNGAGSQDHVAGSLTRELQPAGGTANPTPPAAGSVPQKVAAMTNMANSLVGKPYISGGGHSTFANETSQPGFDCSGFVSAVLHAGGYLSAPQTTATLPDQPGILQGPGQYVTIWDRCTGTYGNQHVIIEINGKWYESGGNPQFNPSANDGVTQMTPQEAHSELAGAGAPFQPFHPAGL